MNLLTHYTDDDLHECLDNMALINNWEEELAPAREAVIAILEARRSLA